MSDQYEQLGIAIEYHIKNYTPEGWIEPIRVCFNGIPFINAEQAQKIAESYKNGSLEKQLKDENPLFGKFPCLISAVRNFFELKEHKKFIS
ncbi:MAG: hypothetical protein Q8N63_08385 [Nanoarchaeota archaeon]|nr:hypothetical protein [Nanoarchaeota archaeon]